MNQATPNEFTQADDLDSPPCCLCGEPDGDLLVRGHDERFRVDDVHYSIVRCRGCGLVRLSPCPSSAALKRYYPGSFFQSRFDAESLARPKRWLLNHRRAAAVREKLAIVSRNTNPPGLLLDVGCAAGEFLFAARDEGWSVVGVELDADTAARVSAELDMDILSGSVLDVDLPEHITACSFWASLEHIPDPVAALKRVGESMRVGGVVFILVPNFGSWEARLAGKSWPHLDIPRHLYHFEANTLARVAEHAGFTPQSIGTPRTRLAVSHWRTVLFGGWRPRTRLLERVLAYGMRPISELLSGAASFAGVNHTLIGTFIKR